MSRFNPKQRLWVIIIALLVVVIILGSYYMLNNPVGESILVLSPDEVMSSSGAYVGKTITVDGYFYHEATDGRGFITSSIIQQGASLTNYKRLPLDYSGVNISLAENVKYRFAGVLIEEEASAGKSIVLVAEKISPV